MRGNRQNIFLAPAQNARSNRSSFPVPRVAPEGEPPGWISRAAASANQPHHDKRRLKFVSGVDKQPFLLQKGVLNPVKDHG
jgi:hypothetical protein